MSKKINFTKANIDALEKPEPGNRTDYQDLKTNGLTIRVSHTGVKTFSVFRRIKSGRLERITLGRYPDMTIEQARKQAMEINLSISEGNNPAEIKRRKNAERTFDHLFNEYIERHSKQNKKTWNEDIKQYNNHIKNHIGNLKVSTIDRSDIAYIHSKITKIGHKYAANRVLALISSVFGWAISAGLIEKNPALGIRRNREKSRDRFLQADEMPRFFQSLSEETNETIRDFVLIALLTGARSANVRSMKWSDINFERAEWRIIETKNGTPQTVTLSLEAIEVLMHRKTPDQSIFVFPGKGKTGHLEEPKKGWERILERAKISDLRIHDLRRTLGSWQAKTGASLSVIGKSLNHKNTSTTAIYARLDLDPVRESVETATSAILSAAGLNNILKK